MDILDALNFYLVSLIVLLEILDSLVALHLVFDLKKLLCKSFVLLFRIWMALLTTLAHQLGSRIDYLVPELFSHTDHKWDHDQFERGIDSSKGWDQVLRVFVLD